MNVTLNLPIVLVAVIAIVAGAIVYRSLPAHGLGAAGTPSRGERLAAAVVTTAGVITIGAFLLTGVRQGGAEGVSGPAPAAATPVSTPSAGGGAPR